MNRRQINTLIDLLHAAAEGSESAVEDALGILSGAEPTPELSPDEQRLAAALCTYSPGQEDVFAPEELWTSLRAKMQPLASELRLGPDEEPDSEDVVIRPLSV